MPKKNPRTESNVAFPSAPELVCIVEPSSGVRSRAAGVASESGANLNSLSATLAAAGAVLRPIFGSEARVANSRDAFAASEAAELVLLC